MQNMRIGIFCGCFNPIHRGHIDFARFCRDAYGLDRVILVPAHEGYPKPGCRLTAGIHRLAMCRIAAAGEPGLEVSALETESGGPCLTCDTVEALKRQYGAEEAYLLCGSDVARGIRRWYGGDRLLREARIVVACREPEGSGREEGFLYPPYRAQPISSTQLRRALAAGQRPAQLSPAVLAYIEQNHLYT